MSQVQIEAGLGRHFMDPSIQPSLMRYAYYLWIAQIINIIAVAFIKWSICAYLLALNFLKSYQVIVWLSILMVTACNFLAPVLTLFGCGNVPSGSQVSHTLTSWPKFQFPSNRIGILLFRTRNAGVINHWDLHTPKAFPTSSPT